MAQDQDWLKWRTTGLGGSDVAAIVGLSPYGSPMSVWLDKTGQSEPKEPTRRMRFGTHAEKWILDEYEIESGVSVVRRGDRIQHRDVPIAIGTLDGVAVYPDGNVVVDAKTAGRDQLHKWGPDGTDQVPEAYLIQMQWYLEITRLGRADVVALFAGDELRTYPIARDPEIGRMLVERAVEFWARHVVTREPPALDASDAAAEYVAKKWPHAEDKTIRDDGSLAALLAELRVNRTARDDFDATVTRLENEVKAKMGDAAVLEFAGGRITWRNVERRITDWKALARDYAPKEAIENATRVETGRRFVAKWDQEER